MATKQVKFGRTKRLELRISPDELEFLRMAAEQVGESLSEWIRELALEAALRALQEHEQK